MDWFPPPTENRELTGNERSTALREFDGFADTTFDPVIEPTERDSWLAKLTEEV